MTQDNYDLKKCLCCNQEIKFKDLFSKIKILHSHSNFEFIEELKKEGVLIDKNTIVIRCPNKSCTFTLLTGISDTESLGELKEKIINLWNKRSDTNLGYKHCPSCGKRQVYEEHESIHQSAVRKEGVYTVNCYSANTGNGCGLSVDIDTGLKNSEVREKAKEIAEETFQFLNKNK